MSENWDQKPITTWESEVQTRRLPKDYVYRGRTVTNNGEDTAITTYNAIESLLKGANLYDDADFLTEILPFFNPTKLTNTYKVSIYIELLDRVCDWRFPQFSREAGREEVGRLIFRGFRRTILGRVMLASITLIGPDRLLKLTPALFKRSVDAQNCSVQQLGPHSYIFDYPDVSGPFEDKIGIFKEGLEQAGALNVQCQVKILAPDHWQFLLEWE